MANLNFEYINHNINSELFQKQTQNLQPRKLLLDTLRNFGDFTGLAIDIGCGSGFDTLKLLQSGWKVVAIDANPNWFKILKSRMSKENLSNVIFIQKYFENIVLPCADLIYSAFSLPFCRPEAFDNFWNKIVNAISKNGRFAGNFFGDKDNWSHIGDMTFKSDKQIYNLFKDFEIEYYDEVHEKGQTILNKPREWHIFDVIAKKQT